MGEQSQTKYRRARFAGRIKAALRPITAAKKGEAERIAFISADPSTANLQTC